MATNRIRIISISGDFSWGLKDKDPIRILRWSICSIPGRKATDSVRLWTTPIFGRPLIVGPVYEEELPAVIGYAEEYAVPVVSPLADVRTSIAMFCFRWHRPRWKYAKIEELTQGEHKQVTLIYGEERPGVRTGNSGCTAGCTLRAA